MCPVEEEDVQPQDMVAVGEVARQTVTFAPYSMAFLLSGYLTPDTVHAYFPGFSALPPVPRGDVEILFGASEKRTAHVDIPLPNFDRIDDREILELVAQVAANSAPNLSSLSGWEWIDIESLLAGHLFSGALPEVIQRLPSSPSDLDIARYSLLSFGPASPRLQYDTNNGILTGDAQLMVVPSPPQVDQGGVLTVRYRIQPLFTPIRIVVLRKRAVAVRGLERLAFLARRGIRRALALVHYGYGLEMMQFPASLPDEVLFGTAPPLIRDFADPALCATIPAPQVLSFTRFTADTLLVGAS